MRTTVYLSLPCRECNPLCERNYSSTPKVCWRLSAMSSQYLNPTKWTGSVGSRGRSPVLLPCLFDRRCGGSNFKLGRLNSPGSGCLTPTYKHNAIFLLPPESKRIFSPAIGKSHFPQKFSIFTAIRSHFEEVWSTNTVKTYSNLLNS